MLVSYPVFRDKWILIQSCLLTGNLNTVFNLDGSVLRGSDK